MQLFMREKFLTHRLLLINLIPDDLGVAALANFNSRETAGGPESSACKI